MRDRSEEPVPMSKEPWNIRLAMVLHTLVSLAFEPSTRKYYLERSRCDSRWDSLWCRAMGHPAGEIFYNPGGLEPDHRCKECGDYLG